MSNKEKAILANETFLDFCNQFGKDSYSIELLQILFEELMKADPECIFCEEEDEETLCLPGEQEQERDQVNNGIAGRKHCNEQSPGFDSSEIAADLGKEDSQDHN